MPFLVLHREGPAHAAGSGSLAFLAIESLGKARLRFRGSNMWPLAARGAMVRGDVRVERVLARRVGGSIRPPGPRAAPSAVFVVALLLFAAR